MGHIATFYRKDYPNGRRYDHDLYPELKQHGWFDSPEKMNAAEQAKSVSHPQASHEPAPSQEDEKADAGCPKCGKTLKRGLTMHIKHCKA